jgi:hypothetical protein
LLAALTNANIGGFLTQPPGFEGHPGLGLVAIHGVPRSRRWDAVASAHARDLTGETVTFVVLDDSTVVVDSDQPDGALSPLADAIEASVSPPYRAAAVRSSGDVWAVAAEQVAVVELPELEGDTIDLTIVDGIRELAVDGERTIRPLPPLDALADPHGDVALHAERFDDALFAVDVFPL